MNTRQVLGLLLLAIAGLLAFSNTAFLVANHANLRDPMFPLSYAFRASIEFYGFAFAATMVGLLLSLGRARIWVWMALVLLLTGSWLFIGRELWLHFVTFPQRWPNAPKLGYFGGAPMWALLPRLGWHVLLPVALVLAVFLSVKKPARDEPAQTS